MPGNAKSGKIKPSDKRSGGSAQAVTQLNIANAGVTETAQAKKAEQSKAEQPPKNEQPKKAQQVKTVQPKMVQPQKTAQVQKTEKPQATKKPAEKVTAKTATTEKQTAKIAKAAEKSSAKSAVSTKAEKPIAEKSIAKNTTIANKTSTIVKTATAKTVKIDENFAKTAKPTAKPTAKAEKPADKASAKTSAKIKPEKVDKGKAAKSASAPSKAEVKSVKADKTPAKTAKTAAAKVAKPIEKPVVKPAQKTVTKAVKPAEKASEKVVSAKQAAKPAVNAATDKSSTVGIPNAKIKKTVAKISSEKSAKANAKPVAATIKSADAAKQISLFDESTFEATRSDMEIIYIGILSYVGKLYLGHFAKSGFGGGIDSILADLTEYIAHGAMELGKKGNKTITEKLCQAVFKSKGEEWKDGQPLAIKITVALDIRGKNKNKYTETLCSDILRIYELLKIAGITRAQAKEMIGGLIKFAVGQGIDIK